MTRRWLIDLAIGARLTLAGGRDGWSRSAMTAVGVALGVAVLLLAASLPNALAARAERVTGREDGSVRSGGEAASDTLLMGRAATEFRGASVGVRLLMPEGPRAPLPPGLSRFPAPGEAMLSPALRDLLAAPEADLLRTRLPYRDAGTIGREGLDGPGELIMYAGVAQLTLDDVGVSRIDRFGADGASEPMPAGLILLLVVIVVVMLLPVAVFVGTAVRFGGEQRDRRLAALRLLGADIRMVRRVAAGEALTASAVGLLLGAGFFLLGRAVASRVTLQEISLYDTDIRPDPMLAVLVALLVSGLAAGITLLALRHVAIEPLTDVTLVLPWIAVAVAGAIALQMLFTGVEPSFTTATGDDLSRAQVSLAVRSDEITAVEREVSAAPGVTGVLTIRQFTVVRGVNDYSSLLVADCATLRELGAPPSCVEGSLYRTPDDVSVVPPDGAELTIIGTGESWRLPTATPMEVARTPMGDFTGLLATPEVMAPELIRATDAVVFVC